MVTARCMSPWNVRWIDKTEETYARLAKTLINDNPKNMLLEHNLQMKGNGCGLTWKGDRCHQMYKTKVKNTQSSGCEKYATASQPASHQDQWMNVTLTWQVTAKALTVLCQRIWKQHEWPKNVWKYCRITTKPLWTNYQQKNKLQTRHEHSWPATFW